MPSVNGYGTIQTNHPRSETILVASGNQALAAGTLTPATGTTMGVDNGQLGLVSLGFGGTVAKNTFLTAGQTSTDAPVVQLVQGTPNSANISNVGPHQFTDKPYVASAAINSRYAIGFSAKVCSGGVYSSFAIGNVSTAAGTIPTTDTTRYGLNITLDGVRQNRYFNVSGFDALHPTFTTPDFTTLAATFTDPRDYIVQRMAFLINLNSKNVDHVPNFYGGTRPILAFAINSAGGAGTTLTAAAAQAVGSTIDFMVKDGITQQFTVTRDFLNTVTQWIASGTNNITGDSTIEVINLTNAGTASGLGSDVIIVMGLDEELPVVRNDLKPVKVLLRVGGSGALELDTLTISELTRPQEQEGTGANWKIEYDMLAAHQVHSEEKWGTNFDLITPPQYINSSLNYTAYIIYHYEKDHGFMSNTQQYPHKTVILIECDQASGTGDAATVASLNAIVAPWLNSATIENTTVSPIAF